MHDKVAVAGMSCYLQRVTFSLAPGPLCGCLWATLSGWKEVGEGGGETWCPSLQRKCFTQIVELCSLFAECIPCMC